MSEKELIERISNYLRIVIWNGRYNFENITKEILKIIERKEIKDRETDLSRRSIAKKDPIAKKIIEAWEDEE